MANYGDFSSLLQLGVGIGIGLSLFRAPVDFRTARLSKVLGGELVALGGIASDFARQKRQDLLALKLRLMQATTQLEHSMIPFMVLAIVGALINLACLIASTLHANTAVPTQNSCLLLFASVGYFVLLIASLEFLARYHLSKLQHDLRDIQQRRAI